ncbi:hypothetical protein P153DRAFT_215104 [Dothidotthia symphoricarpi CBS 119687]|uniref:Uncharacterized protein n=1 Tax=Dothidotthia symphoricarpi CBS 119687 TaxID=1392245 RepID=A0A6A6AEB2_9PLEO|nr:uncharacterized protein P153DRAFT_215104 [Dothidotthia symphoricarpi CBS 119687]KAF2130272.1 hypothetical protein P153DRAFT_215104 [Dothidotthia symphoricarpi CBS 119687]
MSMTLSDFERFWGCRRLFGLAFVQLSHRLVVWYVVGFCWFLPSPAPIAIRQVYVAFCLSFSSLYLAYCMAVAIYFGQPIFKESLFR